MSDMQDAVNGLLENGEMTTSWVLVMTTIQVNDRGEELQGFRIKSDGTASDATLIGLMRYGEQMVINSSLNAMYNYEEDDDD